MPRVTQQELARKRVDRQRRVRVRRRRVLATASIPLIVVGIVAVVIALVGGGGSSGAAGPSSPVPEPSPGGGERPPEQVIATVDNVAVHLPVDPERVTAIVYHPLNNRSAVAFAPAGDVEHDTAPRLGRDGPETAGLDVGAAAGTTVYAPVDGVVASVADYTVSGSTQGYEVVIEPASGSGAVLRMTHLEAGGASERPTVGTAVRAGATVLGQVRDFSPIAEQELAEFSHDEGNHTHLEMVRTAVDLLP